VGAIIIETISRYNNAFATPYFFKRLRQIALDNDIPFVVDENATGVGATGKMWAHEHWYLQDAPDIVTFGGKSGISGFFSSEKYNLDSLGIVFE